MDKYVFTLQQGTKNNNKANTFSLGVAENFLAL
jgi:hypothetical protein